MILPRAKEQRPARSCLLLIVLMLPLALGFLHSAPGRAQSPTKPVFDVATVKIVRAGDLQDDREDIRTAPGTLTMRHVSLKSCIQWAYGLSGFQISGPDWLGS